MMNVNDMQICNTLYKKPTTTKLHFLFFVLFWLDVCWTSETNARIELYGAECEKTRLKRMESAFSQMTCIHINLTRALALALTLQFGENLRNNYNYQPNNKSGCHIYILHAIGKPEVPWLRPDCFVRRWRLLFLQLAHFLPWRLVPFTQIANLERHCSHGSVWLRECVLCQKKCVYLAAATKKRCNYDKQSNFLSIYALNLDCPARDGTACAYKRNMRKINIPHRMREFTVTEWMRKYTHRYTVLEKASDKKKNWPVSKEIHKLWAS